ncbi:hypothetical protein ACLM5J_10355 [Nocardioides sp. Bht2]|uniref:hypothetical protein n=1 Tax=Nocardioides sp. Bht2 TaxID=3392297 RepID=UPI0039B5274B
MTDDRWLEETTARLRAHATQAEPLPAAIPRLRGAVTRRRRRRTATLAAGTVAALGICGVAVALNQQQEPRRDVDLAAPNSPAATPATLPASACPDPLDALGTPPPIDDLAEQKELIFTLHTLSSVLVVHAEPTPLGVVALVADETGDQDYFAEPTVAQRLKQLGVGVVYEWIPRGEEGGSAKEQVRQAIQWSLQDAISDVRARIRGLTGSAGLVLWQEAGALVLNWKRPAPPEVVALQGVRADRVRVELREVTYSDADTLRAARAVFAWAKANHATRLLSSASGCGDGTGLKVGVVPKRAADANLAAQLEEAAGMRVTVVPEERPVDLPGRIR